MYILGYIKLINLTTIKNIYGTNQTFYVYQTNICTKHTGLEYP